MHKKFVVEFDQHGVFAVAPADGSALLLDRMAVEMVAGGGTNYVCGYSDAACVSLPVPTGDVNGACTTIGVVVGSNNVACVGGNLVSVDGQGAGHTNVACLA